MLENPEELNPWPAFIGLIIINLIIILLSFSDPRKQTLLLRLFQNLGACEIRVGMYGVYLNKIHVFCYVTGETVVTLSVVVNKIRADVGVPRHLPHTPISNRCCRCLLDERNRVLVVTLIHQYLKLHVLVYIFNISKSKVAEEIYIVLIIFVNCRLYIFLGTTLRTGRTSLTRIPSILQWRTKELGTVWKSPSKQ